MSKKSFLIIITAVIVFIAAVGGYVYYKINFAPLSFEDIQEQESVFMSVSDKGDVDEAIKVAEKAIERSPEEVSALLNQVYAYLDKGSIDFAEAEYADKAMPIIQKILALDPENSEAYRFLGYAYEIKQQYKESIDAYNKSIQLAPGSDQAYVSRGHAYDLMGEVEKAEQDFSQAYALNPKNPVAAMNLARHYYAKNDFPNTIKYAEEAAKNGTKARLIATAYDLVGLAQVDLLDYEKARISFDAAIVVDKDYEKPYLFRAYVNYLSNTQSDGKLTAGEAQIINKDISKALSLYPGYADAFVQRAEVHIALGDIESAKKDYKTAYSMIDGDITLTAYDKADMKNEITIELKKYE